VLARIEVVGDKARFLVGKAKVLQHGTDIIGMIHSTKGALDEVLDHRRPPAAGGIACRWRAGLNQGGKCLALRVRQLCRSLGRTLIDQTGDAAPEETVEVVTDSLLAEA